jgi:hypothetical protein
MKDVGAVLTADGPLPLVSGPGAEAVLRAGLALRAQVVAGYLAVVIPIAVLVSR